jgi:hypothetical protein
MKIGRELEEFPVFFSGRREFVLQGGSHQTRPTGGYQGPSTSLWISSAGFPFVHARKTMQF